MFETFGAAASVAPGIQELDKPSRQNGAGTFDFDEILRREQEEQDLHAERDNADPKATNRIPQEDRAGVAVERDEHGAAQPSDDGQADAVAEVTEDAESGHVPLVTLLQVAVAAEEANTENEGEQPAQKIDPALIVSTPKGNERQGESTRLLTDVATELASELEEGSGELALQRPQPNPLELLDFNEMMDPDLVIEKAPGQIVTRLSQLVAASAPQLEELAETIMPQITRGIATLVRNGAAEMRLQLQPPDLGEIELRVRTTESAVRGHVVVQHSELKHLVEAQLDKLRESLEAQGLAMEGFDVSVGREGQFARSEEGSETRGDLQGGSAGEATEEGVELDRRAPLLVRGAGNGDLDLLA